MPEAQKQFDFSRGAQLAALRRLRLPDGVSKDGSNVRSATLLAVLRAIDDRCGKNGEQWWDQATLAAQSHLGVRQLGKAIHVLESMHLIHKQDTRRGGARRLVISIDWQTVFSDAEPYQDPTILAAWGLLPSEETTDSNSALDEFNSALDEFNSALSAEFNSAPGAELIRHLVPNSLLSKTPIHPPTLDEGEGVGGKFSVVSNQQSAGRQGGDERETASNVHVHNSEDDAWNAVDRGKVRCDGYDKERCRERNAGDEVADRWQGSHAVGELVSQGNRGVFQQSRRNQLISGPQPSTINPQRSPSPMPTRTIDPRERELIRRLVRLRVGSAVATLREALRIGYSCDQVAAILDWFDRESLTDPETGKTVRPYHPGQIVIRLRDEFATDAPPDCGKWGVRTAEWSALKQRLDGPKPDPGRVPDLSRSKRSAIVESLTREQVVFCLEVLASGDGPDVPRAVKCLAWVERHWPADLHPQPLIPPPAVFKFLMEFDVESILKGMR